MDASACLPGPENSTDAVAGEDSESVRQHWRIGVRALVGWVYGSGDLGAGGGLRVLPGEGLRCQQRWQARQGSDYRSEVYLRAHWKSRRGRLQLAGRMDGLWHDGCCWWVDEVKARRAAPGDAETVPLALEQAWLYAALWARQQGLDRVGVRLVTIDPDDERVQTERHLFQRAELEQFLRGTCEAMLDWLAPLATARHARDLALDGLEFPRPPIRDSQQQLQALVASTLKAGGQTTLEAPTGTGKTLAVLHGALRALPGSGLSRLLFLTARTPGRRAAWRELQLLTEQVPLRVLDLRAGQELCLRPDSPCHPDHCPHARGYFTHRRAALQQLLGLTRPGQAALLDGGRILAVAKAYRICPVRLQRDGARWCDLVVMDLNQAFDPMGRQRSLLDQDEGSSGLLIDEAHNLEQRLRQMFSGPLPLPELRKQLATARHHGWPWCGLLQRLVLRLDGTSTLPVTAGLESLCQQLLVMVHGWLATEARPGPSLQSLRTLSGMLSRYLWATAEAQRDGDGWTALPLAEGGLKLACIQPGQQFQQLLRRAGGAVLFSATLPPPGHLRDVLALPSESRDLRLSGLPPSSRQCTLVVADMDLRAGQRLRNLDRLVNVIERVVRARSGHYLVFVPAFEFLQALAPALERALPDAEVLCQQPEMGARARDRYLDRLLRPDGRLRLALAISGGIFGEGVDLPGAALIGVIVAGVPVPAPDPERRALAERAGAQGHASAYRLPAVQRVRQAAGRLLRTPADRGVVCLVDRRFALPGYAEQLPAEWAPQVVGATQINARLEAFWSAGGSSESGLPAMNGLPESSA